MKFKYYLKKKRRKRNHFYNKIIIIFILSFFRYAIIIYFRVLYEKVENYLKLCSNPDITTLILSERKKFPKISIISPIYNRGEHLLRFLKSIQNQYFEDIEIILIDDFSTDNTINLIKQYKTIDKRIILMRNKKNYGTFKSRNLGILKSNGEYVMLPDPDDILSQDSLRIFYNFAIKYNYEMIRFNLYIGNNKIFFSDCVNQTPSKPVYPPEIQTFLFYATGKLRQIDFNVSNKFIKREALLRVLNLLSKEYLNIYMINFEDGLLNYILYRTVKSFFFLKKVGYYYIRNQNSVSTKGLNSDTIKFIFIYLKIVFLFSKNTFYEKNMFNILFKILVIKKSIIRKLKLMENDSKFHLEALNIFLENEFVSINSKKYIINLKNNLNKNQVI